ncbi:hypothetical protein H4582DRAFT_2033037 [Lactarius indigo]|nr:hypothetical protein H4582DRAFT_2033037 [Lactarius indigo]
MVITSTRNIRHAPMKLSSPATTNSSHPPCSSPSAFHGVDGASNTWTPPQSTAPRASRVRPWSDPSDTEATLFVRNFDQKNPPLSHERLTGGDSSKGVARVPGASSKMFYEYDSTYGSMSLTFIPKSLMMRESRPGRMSAERAASYSTQCAVAAVAVTESRSSPQHRKAYEAYYSYNNVICCRR